MLKEISIKDLQANPINLISEEWLLITAGTQITGFNTMTACWGHLGAIWGHGKGLPTSIVYIRPQRYTKEFVDSKEYYTLSFFDRGYKKALGYLGSHSGRDEDKIKKVGLTPLFDKEYTYFSEAKMVLVCRKLYSSSLIEEGFIDKKIVEDNYPEKDFHEMYIGEIVKILVNTEKKR